MRNHKPLALLHLPDPPTPLSGGSGTYSVSHVGARRIEELERELALARAEIEALRIERNELAAQLASRGAAALVPAPPPVAPPPLPFAAPVAASLAPEAEPEPEVFELVEAELLEGRDSDDSGPVSLSGLMVSSPPPAESEAEASDERRRQARHGCQFEVEFLGDSHLISGLSQDLSQGGVFVATYQKLELGSVVTLGLELPEGRIEVQGEVRWARVELEESEQRPGFGVAFKQLSPEALAALTRFCQSQPAHYYEI